MSSAIARMLGAGLAISVGLNVYLLATRGSSTSPSSPTQAGSGAAVAAPAAEPIAAPPATPSTGSQGRSEAEVAALEKRLDDTQKQLEARLRPSDVFAKGKPSPAVEARVRAWLAKTFEGAPEEFSWDVECTDRACKIEADHGTDYDWMHELQTVRGGQGPMFDGMSFGLDGTYGVILDDAKAARLNLMVGLYKGYAASPRVAECAAKEPTGKSSIKLDVGGGRFRIGEVKGDALTPCATAAIDDYLASVVIPTGVTPEPMTLPYPPIQYPE